MSNASETASTTSVNLNVKLTFKDRFNYAISEFGYNSIYVWISAYMAIFLTDQIGILPTAVSFLTLFVRVFDAINDPIIGSIADRSKDRGKGRYKPWIRWGALAMCIFIILLFAMQPSWNMTFKLVYMWVVYVMVTVCSTCCNMPFGALGAVMTADSEERNKASSLRMVFANIGSSWNSLIAIPLIVFFSGAGDGSTQTANGYFWAVVVTVIIGLPTLFWSSYKTKEVVKAPPSQTTIPLKAQFKAFFKNKYALIIALSFFFIGFCGYGKGTILIYYLTYNCGNAGLMSVAAVLGLIAALVGAGFVGIWFFKIFKSKGLTLGIAYGIAGILAVICYFLPDGSVAWFAIYGLSAVFQAAGIGVAYGMVGDSVDYGEYISGVRVDGFISSFVSLMMKTGGAVGPAILVAWMGAAGYVANVEQTAEVLFVLNFGVSVVVGICCFALLVLGLLFDLTPKKHEEIRHELEARRME